MLKTMKSKILVALALVAALAVGGGVAFAQGVEGGGFFGHRIARVLEKLNLTDQQENLALDVRDELKRAGKAMRQENHAAMDAVVAELDKPKPDAAKLHAVADQRIDAFRKVMHLGIDKFLTLHATFSDDQRQAFSAEMKHVSNMAKRHAAE
jgi:Spy/CpxP family protein refolding chaperone